MDTEKFNNFSPKTIENLSKTAFWMKFTSIFSIIACIVVTATVIVCFAFDPAPLIWFYNMIMWQMLLIVITYIVIIIVIITAAIYLRKAAENYEMFCISKKLANLEAAFVYQKIFWQIIGWSAIISFFFQFTKNIYLCAIKLW